jgi:hypothetical protein
MGRACNTKGRAYGILMGKPEGERLIIMKIKIYVGG